MAERAELLAKASKPAEEARCACMPTYKRKMQTMPKCAIRGLEDFSVWYTPGGGTAKAIQADPDLIYDHTNKGQMIAVVSDGTRVSWGWRHRPGRRVAGHGRQGDVVQNIWAGWMPFPSVSTRKIPDELVRTVRLFAPSFGAINLEDIAMPEVLHDPARTPGDQSDPCLAR